MTLLEVSELSAGYGQGLVLHGVSFKVEEGQIVSILGPNGAGKTTTLRALCGMGETHGRIAFDGTELRGRSPDQVSRRGVAHVLEAPGSFTELTVEEILLVGAYTRRDKDVRAD